MHELSVAAEMFRVVRVSARREDVVVVDSIVISVGDLSCVHPSALCAAFSVVAQDDPVLGNASLQIYRQSVVLRCRRCAAGHAVFNGQFSCVACGSGRVRVERGRDVIVDSYRGRSRDDAEVTAGQ